MMRKNLRKLRVLGVKDDVKRRQLDLFGQMKDN
jgi:hypothetical protein